MRQSGRVGRGGTCREELSWMARQVGEVGVGGVQGHGSGLKAEQRPRVS